MKQNVAFVCYMVRVTGLCVHCTVLHAVHTERIMKINIWENVFYGAEMSTDMQSIQVGKRVCLALILRNLQRNVGIYKKTRPNMPRFNRLAQFQSFCSRQTRPTDGKY